MFYLNVLFGVAIVALLAWKIRAEWADARGETLDVLGALLFGLALLSLIYGLSILPASTSAWLVLAGLLLLTTFVAWEERVPNPVLNIGLFRQRPPRGVLVPRVAHRRSSLLAWHTHCARPQTGEDEQGGERQCPVFPSSVLCLLILDRRPASYG